MKEGRRDRRRKQGMGERREEGGKEGRKEGRKKYNSWTREERAKEKKNILFEL